MDWPTILGPHDPHRHAREFYEYALRHDRRCAHWNRWAVPVGYLGGGLLCWLMLSLFGWPGLLGVIFVGVAYQVWWRRKHGRWMTDDDWMTDDQS